MANIHNFGTNEVAVQMMCSTTDTHYVVLSNVGDRALVTLPEGRNECATSPLTILAFVSKESIDQFIHALQNHSDTWN